MSLIESVHIPLSGVSCDDSICAIKLSIIVFAILNSLISSVNSSVPSHSELFAIPCVYAMAFILDVPIVIVGSVVSGFTTSYDKLLMSEILVTALSATNALLNVSLSAVFCLSTLFGFTYVLATTLTFRLSPLLQLSK